MTGQNVNITAMIAFLVPLFVWLFPAGPRNAAQAATQTQAPFCEPAAGRLDAKGTLAGRDGRYLLVLVQLVDGAETRRVRGALDLRRQPTGMDSMGKASTPLYGFTDVNLRAVGAHRVGDPAGTDPRSPGVLALEDDHDGNRRILLRLGADANRRDSALFDGAYTVLEVRRIDGDGFAGVWRSGWRSSRTSGYFCARRVEKGKPGAGIAPRVE